MINKPTIIITSMGRTGTNFLAEYLQRIFPDALSLHEPEIIALNARKIKITESIKRAGWRASVIDKFLQAEDIKSLSKKRIENKISVSEAAEKIIKLRKGLIGRCEQGLYIESNYRFYGLLDVLPHSFADLRSAYIIRDPRDWVRSFSNFIGLYHWSDIHSYLNKRPSAASAGEMSQKEWQKTNRFEKLAWAWNYANSYAIDSIKNTAYCRLVKFEEVFWHPDRVKNLLEIIGYLKEVGGGRELKDNYTEITEKMLSKKMNESYRFSLPAWTKWSAKQAKILDDHCGRLMEELGYGHEKAWQKLIKSQ